MKRNTDKKRLRECPLCGHKMKKSHKNFKHNGSVIYRQKTYTCQKCGYTSPR